jgi:hypothetical protein
MFTADLYPSDLSALPAGFARQINFKSNPIPPHPPAVRRVQSTREHYGKIPQSLVAFCDANRWKSNRDRVCITINTRLRNLFAGVCATTAAVPSWPTLHGPNVTRFKINVTPTLRAHWRIIITLLQCSYYYLTRYVHRRVGLQRVTYVFAAVVSGSNSVWTRNFVVFSAEGLVFVCRVHV